MNQFELAVLRILLKSATPQSKSKVVNGFPDDSSDFVLSAISDLKRANFIAVKDEGSGNEMLELVKQRKKDVLTLLTPPIALQHPGDQSDSKSEPPRDKGRGVMWIATTLMIIGSLASVYVAYAIGINDRIANHQPVFYRDVRFDIVQLTTDGSSVTDDGKPSWHVKSLGKYDAGVQVSSDFSPKHYSAPEVVQYALIEPAGSGGTYTFKILK